MNRGLWTMCVTVMGIAICSGCTSDLKKRIVMLQDQNRSLSGRNAELERRLQASEGELDRANSALEDLRRRLALSGQEADDLRAMLAALPEPEQAAPGWTPVPGGAMIAIDGEVLFESGRTTLRPTARKTLDAIASVIQGEYADKDLLVFGHTDNEPIRKSGFDDNYQLSTERALSVLRYMKERGVAPSRMIAMGAGEWRPLVGNESPSGRAKNRRVEFYALDFAAIKAR
jgi:chemotaxis protein MotB